MKQNQIKDLTKLKNENFENIFNVYQTENGLYYYNLLQTIEFPQNLPPTFFKPYTIAYGDTWPFISFKVYGSPNLWWVILLANNILNPLKKIPTGTQILTPVVEVVREVLTQINR